MVQYYTLEEAARVLQTSQDEVKKLADTKKVRAFRDRGTLRFRAQDIDEMARTLGLGSDPELQFGEVPAPKRTAATPPPAKKAAKKENEVFDFQLGDDSDQVELGELAPPSASSSSSRVGKSKAGQRTPPPKPGSDSDVRLVADGSDLDFQLADDSAAPAASSSSLGKKKPASTARPDSGVRILPLGDDSDSEVKMVLNQSDDEVALGASKPKTGSDSDIRLEKEEPLRLVEEGSDESLVTEEIDLDAELRKQMAEQARQPKVPKPKKKSKLGGVAGKLPTGSPFELSEEDVALDKPAPKKAPPSRKVTQHAPMPLLDESSDNFELAPGTSDLSPLELSDAEIKMKPLEDDSDEVVLGGTKTAEPGASGINLKDPGDEGLSLEEEGSDVDFELTLDDPSPPKASTKGKPAPKGKAKPSKQEVDSSSEFELSLDDSSAEEQSVAGQLDSEFELSLEADGSSEFELEAVGDDSSSEFELTLDESGNMEAAEESGEEKDIFETDFEVPALDDDSGSEAVALESDTDLESSDFDIALEEGDAESEDESASQVVALEEEEEAEDGAETVARPRSKSKKPVAAVDLDDDDEGFGDLSAEDNEDDDDAVARPRGGAVAAAQTSWGPLPALMLIPSFIVLMLLSLMAFEMLQGMWGYQNGTKTTSLVLRPLSEMLGEKLPE